MTKFKLDGKEVDSAEIIEKLKKAYKGDNSLEPQEFTETRLLRENDRFLKSL